MVAHVAHYLQLLQIVYRRVTVYYYIISHTFFFWGVSQIRTMVDRASTSTTIHVQVIPVIRYEQLRTILYLNNGGQLFVRLALVMRERRSAPNWGRVSLHWFVG